MDTALAISVPISNGLELLPPGTIPDTLRCVNMEPHGNTVRFPSRWQLDRGKGVAAVRQEIADLAEIINRGTEAITGCYMRICDLIRSRGLTEAEVRDILSPHFPPPRISEILRVANAPEQVYLRYSTGFFGFKAALRVCRGYRVTPAARLLRVRARRAAERLILLGFRGEMVVRGLTISVR